MSIFTLGLLRGASEQYVRTKEAEAAAEARRKEIEDERAFQREQAEKQAENQRFLTGRQQYFQERLAEKQQQFQIAQNEQSYFQQIQLAKETQKIEQQALDTRKESAIVDTFGYIATSGPKKGQFVGPEYGGEKRLPDATELGPELQRRVQKGIPTILPNVLGTIPGFDNIITSVRNSSVTMDPISTGLYGADEDFNNGFLTKYEETPEGRVATTITIPGVDPSKGDLKGRARASSQLILKTLTDNDMIGQIMDEYARGERGNFNTVYTAFQVNAGNSLVESMKISGNDANGNIVIQNPVDFTGILTSVKGKEAQRFVAEKIIAPAFAMSADGIRTAMGIPKEIGLSYDETNQRIIIPNPESYEWATEYNDETQSYQIRKDVFKQVQEISKYNGLPNHTVLGLVKDHRNPLKALTDIAETRTQLENNVYMSGGVMQVTEDAKELVRTKTLENNFDSVEDEILYVRTLVKENPNARPTALAISGTGDVTPKYGNRQTKYAINNEDARQMATSARRAEVIADRMLQLRGKNLGGVGLTATITRLAGGGKDIAEALSLLATQYNLDPDTAARFAKNSEALKELGNMDSFTFDTVVQGQKVFDLLGEQLAFAMAAANQGGEGGRAISDRDVEAQRAVMGLTGLLASNTGVEQNLRYLKEQMAVSAAINEQYAKSTDEEDFLAVYIYDQSVERARTLDALLAGAPQKFDEVDPATDDPDQYVIINGRKVKKAR